MPAATHTIQETQHLLRRRTRWLLACPDDHVPDAYFDVVRTMEHMFSLEQELMERYDFPLRKLHLEQHARVLRGLHCVHGEVMRGDPGCGRRAGAQLLTDWLQLHRDTLDASLGIWVDCCRNGPSDPRAPGAAGKAPTAH